MEESCPYLKDGSLVRNLNPVVYCSIDYTPLYRACCPPKNIEKFYICFQDYKSCKKVQNLEDKIN